MRCWYARWQMSNALDRDAPGRGDLASRMARGHAARCARCQAFGRSLESLHAQLSRGAHAAATPVAILGLAPGRAGRRTRRPLLVAAPLAVAAGAAIVIAIGQGDPPARSVPVPPPLAVQAPSSPVVVTGIADRVAQAFTTTPLDTELDDLLRDSKRGLDAVLAAGGLR